MPTATIPPPSSLPTLAQGPTTRTPSTRHTTTKTVGRTSPSKNNNRQPPHRTSVPHAQPPLPTRVSKAPSTTKLDLTLTSGNSKKLAPLPPTTSSSTHHRPPTLPSRLRGRVEQNQPANNGARGGGSVVSSSSRSVSGPNQRGGGGSGGQRPATQHQPLPPPSPQPSDNDPPPRHQQQEEPENVKTATTTTTNFPEPALPPQLAKAVWNAVDTCTYVYNLKTDPTGIKRRLAREAEEEEIKMKASRKVKQNGKSATFVRGRPNGSSTSSIVVNIATLNKTGSKSKDAAVLKSAVEKCKNVLDDVELPLTTVVIDERVVASPSGKYAFTFVQTDCVWEQEGTSSHSMTYITVKICDAPQQTHNSKAAVIRSIQQQQGGGGDDNGNIEVLANYFRDSYSAHMDVEASGVSSGWSGAGHIHWDPTQPSDLVAKIDGEWVSRRFDSGPSSTWPSYCVGVSPAP